MHQHLAALTLSLLVVTAGCSGLVNSDDSTPIATPEASTSTTEENNSLDTSNITFPNGTSENGFENVSHVLSTHQARLASDDYQSIYNLTHVRSRNVVNTTTVITSNQTQQQQHLHADLPQRTIDQFTSNDVTRSRTIINGTVYDSRDNSTEPFQSIHQQGAQPGKLLTTILSAGNYTATKIEQHDSRKMIVYNTTGPRPNSTGQLPDKVNSLSGTVKIDQSGRIWDASILVTGETDGTSELLLQEYRTTAIENITVSRPEWMNSSNQPN